MRDQPLAACPRLVVHLRKTLLNCSHDPFCPLGLLFSSHLVFYHLQHHAMDAVALAIDIQSYERVASERLQCFVEREWVLGRGKRTSNYWAELRGSLGEQFERDAIWTQESAYPQHIGCDQVLFHLLEVERPGTGYGRRVLACPGLCFVKQGKALPLVTGEIVLKACSFRCHVGSRLFQCQRQVTQFCGQALGCVLLFRVALGACCACVEKVQRFLWMHLREREWSGNAQRVEDLCSGGEQDVTSGCTWVSGFEHLRCIGIIKDEQPFTRVLQPVLEGLHRVSRIGGMLFGQVKQLRDLDTACLEFHLGLGPDPEDETIFGTVAIGILNSGLCLADASQSADGVSLR